MTQDELVELVENLTKDKRDLEERYRRQDGDYLRKMNSFEEAVRERDSYSRRLDTSEANGKELRERLISRSLYLGFFAGVALNFAAVLFKVLTQ